MKSYETWDILNINWLAGLLPSTVRVNRTAGYQGMPTKQESSKLKNLGETTTETHKI